MAYTKYSLTPANNNATPPDGAPEGMLPSAVNDTMRDMMAQIRDCGDGIRDGTYTMTAPKITGGTITGSTINNSAIGGTTANSGAFTTLSASGVATFSAGTVSAPALTTTGDTNTGIFFPAADTIAFTEGGVEAMRINSSANIGIGTNTPSGRLHVATTTNTSVYAAADAGYSLFRGVTNSSGGVLSISGNSTGNGINFTVFNAALNGYEPANYDGSIQIFKTSNTERMRITSAGDVGIGQSSPVNIAGYTIQTINNSNTGAGVYLQSNGTTIGRILNTATDFFVGGVSASSACILQSGGAERMRIDSSGRVMIGNTSTNSQFNVKGAASQRTVSQYIAFDTLTTTMAVWERSDGAVSCKLDYDGSGLINFGTSTAHALTFLTSNTERMRIESGGNVAIGITTASYRLHVRGGSGNGIAYDDGTVINYLGTTGSNLGYLGTLTNHPVAFLTNAAERMRITSGGALLIGSTSLSNDYTLKVTNGATNTGLIFTNAGGTAVANDGTLTSNVGNGSIFMVSENITGDGALFFCGYKSATVTLVADPNGRYANSVTAGRICVTKSANSGTVTITNKTGSSQTITVARITNSD